MNRFLRKWTGFAAIACIIVLVLTPASVFAHAYVVASNPAANETLDTSPEMIVIDFNEPIEAGFHKLEVIGPNGDDVTEGEAAIDPQ